MFGLVHADKATALHFAFLWWWRIHNRDATLFRGEYGVVCIHFFDQLMAGNGPEGAISTVL